MQWNVEAGLHAIDKYMYAEDPQIKVRPAYIKCPTATNIT